MAAIGGSIHSITIDGREFAVAADADSNRKIGGYENEIQANGDFTGRLIKTAVTFMLDGIEIEIDDARGDHQFLQELQDKLDFINISIEYASGAVWAGTGQIVQETQVSSQKTTASISLSGNGKLQQL